MYLKYLVHFNRVLNYFLLKKFVPTLNLYVEPTMTVLLT